MKATVSVSKARVADVEVGDVIRYDVHGGSDKSPKWSHWLEVKSINHDYAITAPVTFVGTQGRELLRKLDIVEVQHRSPAPEVPA